jgi:hypothetical protein
MESRIPLPTDNIYKFYALFGLFLLVFSIGALLYTHQSANERFFTLYPQLEGLKQLPHPTAEEKARTAILERTFEISKADKDFFANALGLIAGGALCVTGFGFYKWEKELQPIQDRTAKAQAELQLLKLRRELGLDDKNEEVIANTENLLNSGGDIVPSPPAIAHESQPQVI